MTRLHVLVRGRVQGVGFRWFIAGQARRLGVDGWVKNTADGCVEVAAEGPEAAVAGLRRVIHQGPAAARVEAVDELAPVAADEAAGGGGGFQILR